MKITININEVAFNLAQDRTIDEVLSPMSDFVLLKGYTSENDLYEISINLQEPLVYKEEVQRIFDKWYNFYIDILKTYNI